MITHQTTPTFEFEQASSIRRLLARFIDLILIPVPWVLINVLILFLMSQLYDDPAQAPSGEVVFQIISISLVATIILFEVIMTSLFGGTVGKLLLGMRVVNIRGEKISLLYSLVRVIGLYLYLTVVVIGIIITASILGWYLLRTLPQYHRFPHEHLSRSYVVRVVKAQLQPAPSSPLPAGDTGQPTPIDDLARLYTQGLISKEAYEQKLAELQKGAGH